MTLGTGIFLSSIFLGIIALYIATKDRWKWKKIVLRTGAGFIAIILVGGLLTWGYVAYQDVPRPIERFWGLTIGMPSSEVKFQKGLPKDDEKYKARNVWVYTVEKGAYFVAFKDDKVRWVGFSGKTYDGPSVKGIYSSSTFDELSAVYGTPSYISYSKDGLERLINYDKYNLFATVSAEGVSFYGMFDSVTGPVKFADPKPEQPAVDK